MSFDDRELKLPVVFLDRDGVINENSTQHVKSWQEFTFRPGVAKAIRDLNKAGFVVVVVTNQAIIGRGLVPEREVQIIHTLMCRELAQQGAWICKVYYCPHRPEDHCTCRKPSPGLVDQAFVELPLDRKRAYLVGDHFTDIASGQAAGLTNILISGGRGSLTECGSHVPDMFAPDLPAAAHWILADLRAKRELRRLLQNQDKQLVPSIS